MGRELGVPFMDGIYALNLLCGLRLLGSHNLDLAMDEYHDADTEKAAKFAHFHDPLRARVFSCTFGTFEVSGRKTEECALQRNM